MDFTPKQFILLTSFVALIGTLSFSIQSSFAQTNNTFLNEKTDNEKFHSNVEQIIGHIKMAEFNKNNNNQTLAFGHTIHPTEEVLSLITIPLANHDHNLNDTYYKELFTLSSMALPGNSTNEQFSKQAKESIDLSNKVISTVIPAHILNNTNHNITVIQNLLTTSTAEYSEGVNNSKIIMALEYQDGSAFIERAFDLFNHTKSISKERNEIFQLFNNLTNSVEQLKNPKSIDSIVEEINNKLAESPIENPKSNTIATNVSSNTEKNTTHYISNIRQLLDQVISSYQSGNTVKAKELATTAYLDNFEYVEKHISKDLADNGEDLLRIQLRDKISQNSQIGEIKEIVNNINKLLNEAEKEYK